MFAAQRQHLEGAGFRTVTLDLRGHGESRPNSASLSADLFTHDVETLIEHLSLSNPGLIGLSLGGNLAQRLVRLDPSRYSALAVLDSTWNAGPLTTLERIALRAAAPLLGLIPASRLPKMMADASAVTDTARVDLIRAFSQVTKRDSIAIWRATTQFVNPDPDYRTPIPLLLIRGIEDHTGNIATAMTAWAAAEGVAPHIIPNAGHVVTQDCPDNVSELLATFFLAHT